MFDLADRHFMFLCEDDTFSYGRAIFALNFYKMLYYDHACDYTQIKEIRQKHVVFAYVDSWSNG